MNPCTARRLLLGSVTFLIAVASCGTVRQEATMLGALPALTDVERRGEIVFMERCHKCHPHGEAGLGPAINGKPLPSPLMRLQIRKGLGAMPAFGDALITAAQLDDLLDYLDTK